MAVKFLNIKLTSGTRIKAVETDNAYAIQLYKSPVFIPKSVSKIEELKHNEHGFRWCLSIRESWAMDKPDVLDALEYLTELNEFLELAVEDKANRGLDMVNKFLNN